MKFILKLLCNKASKATEKAAAKASKATEKAAAKATHQALEAERRLAARATEKAAAKATETAKAVVVSLSFVKPRHESNFFFSGH